MKLNISTKDGATIPVYQTQGAVAFDVAASKKTTIKARSLKLVPTGCVIEVPKGYALLLCARSSTPKKKGLLMPHGVGIIDQDYCGKDDELFIQYYNFTDDNVTIQKGERCAQGLLVKIGTAEFKQVDELSNTSRGGFGSTGL